MGQFARLDSATLDALAQVHATDSEGESQRGQGARSDQSVDRVPGEAEEVGRLGHPQLLPVVHHHGNPTKRAGTPGGPARHHLDGGSRRAGRQWQPYVPSAPGD